MTAAQSGPLLSPGFWLHHAALAWRAEFDAQLAPLGLTPTQFLLLASAGWLEHQDGPATQQQIADLAGADRTMASKVMRTLVDNGLIRRVAHESDGRSVRIRLTPAGRELTAQAVTIAQEVDSRLFGPQSADLRATLRHIAENSRHRTPPR
ncbi:MarR family winged helix-turn-helix transcriptional regulator [Krasilnikovia sp. MM14-A1259]|uniref:MarR family winged helix-turn-helix transcriptional regulator n=1 Tax=Krasilnikovia sp. MM14-A1259 TaxID=3373539 RepID=UPI003825B36C